MMSANEISAYVDTLSPDEIRAHAERFVFMAANCIIERHRSNDHDIWLPLVYNNMPVDTVDYLLGKIGVNPTVENILERGRWFGRLRLDGCRRRLAPG